MAETPHSESDRVRAEMEALVAISSPWGDETGAEACLALAQEFAPAEAIAERIRSSSSACVDDLTLTLTGTGHGRLMLLGHVDTVISHDSHRPAEPDGDRIIGSGTADMKGGVAISLAVMRTLAATPERYAELTLLLVTDEEWRTQPFAHVDRFTGFGACLCFEAGARLPDTDTEAVIVKRKGAGTVRVRATGRAAHSGSQPDQGRNALVALAKVAGAVVELHDPSGPDHLTVVPTIMHAGEALNMVPPSGELVIDVRCDDTAAFSRVVDSIPADVDGVALTVSMERVWPAMDARAATGELLTRASEVLGSPIVASGRGGASDASHFAPTIPLTVDGLGPRGGGAHNPDEFVSLESISTRTAIATAVATAALDLLAI